MAYVTTNPPRVMVPSMGGGMQIWSYSSADTAATASGTDYFSNGAALGMRVGDCILGFDSNVGDGYIAFVTAVTAGGAATAAETQAVTS